MSDDKDSKDDMKPTDGADIPADGRSGDDGLSDDQVDAAFADFEAEFKDMGADLPDLPDLPDQPDAPEASDAPHDGDQTGPADGSADDVAASFEDELAGLVGDKAKAALVITTLRSAELLAAFCALADVSALCVDGPTGACAVLRNLDGEAPESAARDLTIVVSGLSLVLAVNRASKLEAHIWLQGKSSEESFPPPVLFMSTPGWAEDYLIGSIDEDTVRAQNDGTVDSGDIDRQRALDIIARHTRRGRGPRGGAIE